MKRFPVAVMLLLVPAVLLAQPQNATKPKNNAVNGFRAEFLANFDDVQSKIMKLAEAVPASKYAWRPENGVRSVSEVYMHIAGANYYLSTFLGSTPPPEIPNDIEKIAEKERVLAELKKSFEHIRAVAAAEKNENLDQRVKMFGNSTTRRGVLLTALNHLHEHLGQSIAYARMNGVVPPWSR